MLKAREYAKRRLPIMFNWEGMLPYIKSDYYWAFHHERYKNRVTLTTDSMLCQDCGGAGDWVEPILDDGSGPTETCGWCEGTGFVTKHRRGAWLRYKRECKNAKKE